MNPYYYVVILLLVMFVSLMYGIYSYADNPKAPQPKTYSVYKFGAEWCQPCKQLKFVFDTKEVQDKLKEIRADLLEIDIDKNEQSTQDWHIGSIPTVILVEDTENGPVEIRRFVGAKPRSFILEFLDVSKN